MRLFPLRLWNEEFLYFSITKQTMSRWLIYELIWSDKYKLFCRCNKEILSLVLYNFHKQFFSWWIAGYCHQVFFIYIKNTNVINIIELWCKWLKNLRTLIFDLYYINIVQATINTLEKLPTNMSGRWPPGNDLAWESSHAMIFRMLLFWSSIMKQACSIA